MQCMASRGIFFSRKFLGLVMTLQHHHWKFLCGHAGLWTHIAQWKSRNWAPWCLWILCILILCANIFLIPRPSGNWEIKKNCAWRWSWEKIFDFQFHSWILKKMAVVQYHSIKKRVWPEFAPPHKMALLPMKFSTNFSWYSNQPDIWLFQKSPSRGQGVEDMDFKRNSMFKFQWLI